MEDGLVNVAQNIMITIMTETRDVSAVGPPPALQIMKHRNETFCVCTSVEGIMLLCQHVVVSYTQQQFVYLLCAPGTLGAELQTFITSRGAAR